MSLYGTLVVVQRPPTRVQRMAVWLAFLAAALSFTAVAIGAARTGRIEATPLFGGLLMLGLGIAGIGKLRGRT
jgi:hypothetical protein